MGEELGWELSGALEWNDGGKDEESKEEKNG